MFCRTCGKGIHDGQLVCTSCGYKPNLGTSFCFHCGQPTGVGQAACISCGFQLSEAVSSNPAAESTAIANQKMFCRSCGKAVQVGQTVCLSCGYKPIQGSSYCFHCGQPTGAGQAVCTSCGFQIDGVVGTKGSGKASTVGILTLVGGIWAAVDTLIGLVFLVGFGISTFGIGCLLVPLLALPGATAIMGITQGIKLVGKDASKQKAPLTVSILQICCILFLDVIQCGMGIASLVMQNDPEVKAFYRG